MKKVYDWDVGLTIKVHNNNKTLNIVCSVHTLVHQIKIQLCKKLGLMILDTDIDIYGGTSRWAPMKPTSTLLQNGIETKSATLTSTIRREKPNPKLEIHLPTSPTLSETIKQTSPGLSLTASCTNPQCLNYQQDIEIHLGHGRFPFYSTISQLRCQVCPYRAQHLRPAMMCKGVFLGFCCYKMEGTKTDDGGIPKQMSTNYTIVKHSKRVMDTILGKNWDRNIEVIVKPL